MHNAHWLDSDIYCLNSRVVHTLAYQYRGPEFDSATGRSIFLSFFLQIIKLIKQYSYSYTMKDLLKKLFHWTVFILCFYLFNRIIASAVFATHTFFPCSVSCSKNFKTCNCRFFPGTQKLTSCHFIGISIYTCTQTSTLSISTESHRMGTSKRSCSTCFQECVHVSVWKIF